MTPNSRCFPKWTFRYFASHETDFHELKLPSLSHPGLSARSALPVCGGVDLNHECLFSTNADTKKTAESRKSIHTFTVRRVTDLPSLWVCPWCILKIYKTIEHIFFEASATRNSSSHNMCFRVYMWHWCIMYVTWNIWFWLIPLHNLRLLRCIV